MLRAEIAHLKSKDKITAIFFTSLRASWDIFIYLYHLFTQVTKRKYFIPLLVKILCLLI